MRLVRYLSLQLMNRVYLKLDMQSLMPAEACKSRQIKRLELDASDPHNTTRNQAVDFWLCISTRSNSGSGLLQLTLQSFLFLAYAPIHSRISIAVIPIDSDTGPGECDILIGHAAIGVKYRRRTRVELCLSRCYSRCHKFLPGPLKYQIATKINPDHHSKSPPN